MDLSIVVPVYEERDNLRPLHAEITAALDVLPYASEIVYVDDGSRDGSVDVLREIGERDARTRVVRFRRNFGQTAAMSAGFDYARGAVIITMDADLQNDPADIGMLMTKLAEGYDIVSGWRKNRQDGFVLRKLPSRLANRLICRITGVRLHDFGCTLKAYRREVVENIRLYGEMHRFIPALAHWIGADTTEMVVNHRARVWGRSKYGISRTIRVVLDLVTIAFLMNFATRPIQVFGRIGLASGFAGTVICGWLTIGKFVVPDSYSLLERMPMLLLGVLLIFVGVQFITMGLLGELMTRTYHEAQGKPIYVVREVISAAPPVDPA
ncbi:glycosyltransferase family 2 protein [Candidatus Poribacteria bacterium]|nr:glycosyltransferase family 2 protein [Candidatus Poribacteria bacterium]MBT5536365.1 glycosyltransferase family 2 protein [Candidatus Poribacteria bacterium]MBT5713401.1 glycosyltransferase family 2 protein [Candidatus Poribacteria bacterium]MBT7098261.1 glycosyltransferase family 2 protein [Candidatus Poribacteria bacterium]